MCVCVVVENVHMSAKTNLSSVHKNRCLMYKVLEVALTYEHTLWIFLI